MTAVSKRITDVISTMQKLDTEWQRNPAGRDDPRSLPWMSFSWPDFIALVAEALPDAPGDKFLDVGCGIGSKMLLAKEIFGLDVQGIERVPGYVRQARELGLDALEQDALVFSGYDAYDIVWLNRPFSDPDLQVRMERKVQEGMKSGAVFIGVNLLNRPPGDWWVVLDDWEVHRGIWQKP